MHPPPFAWLCGVLIAVACTESAEPRPLTRTGPLGSLRDLVYFDRSPVSGGPFFLDTFEATRGDFAEFALTPAGRAWLGSLPMSVDEDRAVLPMSGVDLAQARAFAHWRRCRLPRSDEWTFACTTDGRDAFPWGRRAEPARANTSDLGVFAALPVGTFESGRAGRSGPYDLIGNVAEWTETVPVAWYHADRDALSPFLRALLRTARTPGLAAWGLAGVPPPAAFAVAAAGDLAVREVLGSDFASPMSDGPQLHAPGDRGDTIGVRLCTTPGELLLALAADVDAFGDGERLQIARFFARANHAVVLRPWFEQLPLPPAGRRYLEALLP